ncbi:sigma-54 dependent transcriptional regulator [soil metagenome]
MSDNRILIVHSEPSASALLSSMLQSLGHQIEEITSDRAAARRLERDPFDMVIAGVDPCDPDSLELLMYLRRKFPEVPVVLLFSVAHPERTREALQRGASSVLRFPLPATQLRAAVAQALGRSAVNGPVPLPVSTMASSSALSPLTASTVGQWRFLDGQPLDPPPISEAVVQAARAEHALLIGEDQSFRQAIELAETIAPTRAAVLIQGEQGTGKGLLARALHQQSHRGAGPFDEVDCGVLRGSALEVELFGRHATGRGDLFPESHGKIALARGGTLYLDEIASLSPEVQYRLLRLLQEHEYEPVGSTQTIRSDVRLVLGTTEDLAELVEQGLFRQDLYYRISVVSLKIPPLRHRGQDLERLADHFLTRFAQALGKNISGFTPEALDRLQQHTWPGNVQELEMAVERAVVLARGNLIEAGQLGLPSGPLRSTPTSSHQAPSRRSNPGIRPLKEALEEPEKRIILQALEALNWNRQETARVLDINRTTLYKKMKKYSLLDVTVEEKDPAWAN